MIHAEPVEFRAALDSQRVKTALPTTLGTQELAELPVEVRERARFSATMDKAEHLQVISDEVEAIIKGEQDTATAALNLKKSLDKLGYAPKPEEKGTLKDHRSFKRQQLVLKTNVAQAGGYGQWKQDQSEEALDLYPAKELFRAINRKVPRDWLAKWVGAGGKLYNGRMIARADDPIWMKSLTDGGFNRFGTPYTPFDFNSGMRTRPIDREEAIALGVITADEKVKPTPRAFDKDVQAAPEVREGIFTAALKTALGKLGNQYSFVGGILKWARRKGGAR